MTPLGRRGLQELPPSRDVREQVGDFDPGSRGSARAAFLRVAARLQTQLDDQTQEQCRGPALIETIRTSLRWLTETVRDRGNRLLPGQIVLTGSIPSLIPIRSACRVLVTAPPFGQVEAQFD